MSQEEMMAKSKSKKVVDDEDEVLEDEVQTKSKSNAKGDPYDDDPKPLTRRAKTGITKTALVFIFLNWLAVLAFLYFAWSDYVVRMQYSYRTILNYVAAYGLPLKSEEEFSSAENETRPRIILNDDQLRDAFKARKTGKPISPKEAFVYVDEPVPLRLRPSDMTPSLQQDVFGKLKDPVATLEDEITRVNNRLPGDN